MKKVSSFSAFFCNTLEYENVEEGVMVEKNFYLSPSYIKVGIAINIRDEKKKVQNEQRK
jgi:hypothetical protein